MNRRFNKIVLVNFYYPNSGYGTKLNYPPLGIGYIAENLLFNGFNVDIIDMGIGKNMDDGEKLLGDKIIKFNPDIIGFSLNSINIKRSLEIIKYLATLNKDVKILVGGPHASSTPKELLNNNKFIDYVSVHEGEYALRDLMLGLDENQIDGLVFRKNNQIISNPSKTILNIDELKWPKYEKFDLNGYLEKDSIGVITSRGCPYLCGFCQQSSLIGKTWRGRSPIDVVDEIEYWANRNKSSIYLIDDMFLMDKKRVFEISNLICERKLNHLDFISVGGFRINHCDYDTLLALKKMGVKEATFGIESGTDRVLKFIKKNITCEKIEQVIKQACDLGFKVKLFFIIGLPTQTKEEVEESFKLALKFPIYQVRFFNFIPYNDTYLMDWLKENDAEFFYEYDEYMENFKKFQDIPIFEDKEGMTIKEKEEMLAKARTIEKQIEER